MILSYPLSNPPATPIPVPARRTPQRSKYDSLIAMVVQAGGSPIAVTDLSLIGGESNRQKSVSVQGAARARQVRVKTSHQNGYLYISLLGPRTPGTTEVSR